jgi:hypothetical protein
MSILTEMSQSSVYVRRSVLNTVAVLRSTCVDGRVSKGIYTFDPLERGPSPSGCTVKLAKQVRTILARPIYN